MPAMIEETSIWLNACPDAAVPLVLGKQSSALIEINGMAEAIPILYKAINKIFNQIRVSKKVQNSSC